MTESCANRSVAALAVGLGAATIFFASWLYAEPKGPTPTNDPADKCDANYTDCYMGCHQPANQNQLQQCLAHCEEKWRTCKQDAGRSISKKNPPVRPIVSAPAKSDSIPTRKPKASARVTETTIQKVNPTPTSTPTPSPRKKLTRQIQ